MTLLRYTISNPKNFIKRKTMRRIIFSPAISNKHIHTKIYIPTNTRARLLKFY